MLITFLCRLIQGENVSTVELNSVSNISSPGGQEDDRLSGKFQDTIRDRHLRCNNFRSGGWEKEIL
jgi:hypothetical protein